MTLQHMPYKLFREALVCGLRSISEHDIIDHPESGHQLRPRTLRQQRMGWIGHLHHKIMTGFGSLPQEARVAGKQRIEVAGDPAGGFVPETLAHVFGRNDFGSRVQESLV